MYKSKFVRVANWDNLTQTSSLLLGLLNSHAPMLPPPHTKPPLFLNTIVRILNMVLANTQKQGEMEKIWVAQSIFSMGIPSSVQIWNQHLFLALGGLPCFLWSPRPKGCLWHLTLLLEERSTLCSYWLQRVPSGGHLESALGDWLLYAPTPPILRRAFYSKGILKLRNIDYLHCVWEILKTTELRGRWMFRHDVYICYDRHSFF